MRPWRAACLAAVSCVRFIVPHQHCDSILPNYMGPHGEILSLSGHSLAPNLSPELPPGRFNQVGIWRGHKNERDRHNGQSPEARLAFSWPSLW